MRIKVKDIRPSPFQVRSEMNGEPLQELMASMLRIGLAVPVKVRPVEEGYELVYGHRRVEAARRLKWITIEAVVEDLTDEQVMEQGLAENVTRNDLEPLDEARAYKSLIDEFGWSWAKISKRFGVSDRRIDATLKLLDLPDDLVEKVTDMGAGRRGASKSGEISRYHVEEAAAAGDDFNIKVARKAVDEGLSVAQTRKVAKAVAAAPTDKLKERLIETPYSEFVHDPERIEEVAQKRGGIDPLLEERKPKQKIWEKPVADFLRYLKQMNWWLDDFQKAIEEDLLSPEAKPFVADRLRPVRDKIDRIIKLLEE